MTPYVTPFVLYLLVTQLGSLWPEHYALAYAVPVAGVGVGTFWFLRGKGILQPHSRVALGVLTGVVGVVLWIGLAGLNLEAELTRSFPGWLQPEAREGFNPFEALDNPFYLGIFLVIRISALTLLVPVAEEVFWRGFLLRWVASRHWENEPIGRFTPGSFAAVTILFALAHPEWVAAAVYSMLLNGLLYRTRDLWSCVVAHAVSNLLLVIYILASESWTLW